VLPAVSRNDDRQSDVQRGCNEGVASAGVRFTPAGSVDAALAGRKVDDLDDAAAVSLGKRLGADAVIVGAFAIGHFSNGVKVRLIRVETGAIEATAEVEDPAVDVGAKRACAALLQ
jgi:hypothetical protein